MLTYRLMLGILEALVRRGAVGRICADMVAEEIKRRYGRN